MCNGHNIYDLEQMIGPIIVAEVEPHGGLVLSIFVDEKPASAFTREDLTRALNSISSHSYRTEDFEAA